MTRKRTRAGKVIAIEKKPSTRERALPEKKRMAEKNWGERHRKENGGKERGRRPFQRKYHPSPASPEEPDGGGGDCQKTAPHL